MLKLAVSESSRRRYASAIPSQGSGREIIDKACHLHLEGIISKRRGSPYRPGRGLDWLKVKCSKREEFVIGGFTKPERQPRPFRRLVAGLLRPRQEAHLCRPSRHGVQRDDARALHRKLAKLVQARSPYSNLSGTSGEARDVSWVKPVLVAEIQFSNWTDEGLLRHPSFQGLREDKPAGKVIHDEPLSLSEVKAMENGRKAATPQQSRKTEPSPVRRPAAGRTADADPTTNSPACASPIPTRFSIPTGN